ncbi:flagellar hook-length control protein FliK [Thermosediminibacter litoriperuensis]|uniref:Flagellar hook-length control protein FliK n=1 Tax=Thermosediminibacter litoriperuensis TaxID=291989 RepID=A0A5S5AYZ2_9FIRM|nr:flagellar hook-length control protein FliK [Thermosediminibacter litoriperuensis]TYP59927.1 flagellar hook-length control protein FliK [Thermosediminibacter litoriperuensis]
MFAESAAFFPVLANQTKVDLRRRHIDEERGDFKNLLGLLQQESDKKNLNAAVCSVLLQLINLLYQDLKTTEETANSVESADRLMPGIITGANQLNKGVLPLLKNIVIKFEKSGEIDNLKILQLYRKLCESIPQLKSLDLQDFKDHLEHFLQKSVMTKKLQTVPRDVITEGRILKNQVQSKSKSELSNTTSHGYVLNINKNTTAKTTVGSYESTPNGQVVETLEDKTETIKVGVQYAAIDVSADDKAFTTERAGAEKNTEQKPEQFFKTEIFDKVVAKVQMALKGQAREMRIKLKPEFLGDIVIKIVAVEGEMSAELFVKNAYIRETLQANANEIKNQIQQQGYSITEVKVYEFSSQLDMNQNGHKFENGEWYNTFKKAGSGSTGGTRFEEVEAIDRSETVYYQLLGPSTINYVV